MRKAKHFNIANKRNFTILVLFTQFSVQAYLFEY